ncbi:HD domain-containing protein [Flavobacterium columnare NBRC 100251 = ATCC 23463]|uniref:Hydrolase n=1 Tax=Flavobacterium columnare (strain ATCC 49512 / CIP 103533 / TG 44/87) TaxID=1041826 RepID=G8XBC0_FLACA|nr:HD domain-containing protein [Flavobacterium columnare]AEW86700.1 hydrolase [Flavobacterium columnare ATCC 49512]ANO47111.1 hydrolase [Flavobacterium columnare]APT22203.1 phosphohydrolase [Flavobacterium columnare]OOB82297.1 phosphohydrolase [Flavobacterium columnare]PDS23343.1 HD domain-containing protein [Flavobacterium columnare NBRC 100251 = ATCC 23463]
MEIIQKTIEFVKKQLEEAEGGHDWFHIERVYKNARQIAKEEECNETVVYLAALLHDIADSKFYNGDETIGPKTASDFLTSQNIDQTIIDHVVKIIENISFKGGNFAAAFHSKELAIVQDADRLDAIGAIGIARAFNYGGFKNRKLYDPAIIPNLTMSKEEYKNTTSPTINHFYEKLLRLKDKMNTTAGKRIALQRHLFMEQFLEQFYDECEGIK